MTESNDLAIDKIFCDESCHLQHDKAGVMVLGALYCPGDQLEKVVRHIKFLRHQHNSHTELKWTKLIGRQQDFYRALIDYFMVSSLRFKATIVQDKSKLNHEQFNQGSHNNFYYKMFYYTLRDFLKEGREYRVYLDYMDTHGREKGQKLEQVLENHAKGQGKLIPVHSQTIRSYESQLIQLCDLFIGAISYRNRSDIVKASKVKSDVITHLEAVVGLSLDKGTPPWEDKFNLFLFQPRASDA